MVEHPHSVKGARVRFPDDAVQYLAFGEKYWDLPILYTDSKAQWYSVHILSGGAWVRFPDDAVQYLAFGEKYWDVMYTLLGCDVYITSQYLTPAIIYRDIMYALCPSSTPPPPNNSNIQEF
jgi:hypothetical protein